MEQRHRCYRDSNIVITLMGIAHRGARGWEREVRRDFLHSKARYLVLLESNIEKEMFLRKLQSL